jgi:hypothetical protein
MVDENDEHPSWRAFLIDFSLATKNSGRCQERVRRLVLEHSWQLGYFSMKRTIRHACSRVILLRSLLDMHLL